MLQVSIANADYLDSDENFGPNDFESSEDKIRAWYDKEDKDEEEDQCDICTKLIDEANSLPKCIMPREPAEYFNDAKIHLKEETCAKQDENPRKQYHHHKKGRGRQYEKHHHHKKGANYRGRQREHEEEEKKQHPHHHHKEKGEEKERQHHHHHNEEEEEEAEFYEDSSSVVYNLPKAETTMIITMITMLIL